MKPADQLIQRIMAEQPKPVSRWSYLLRSRLSLIVFIIALLFGGLAVSVILLTIQQSEFNLLRHMGHSPVEMFLGLLPLIWVILVIAGLGLSMYVVAQSARGYKFTLVRLFLDSAALSIFLGMLFFIAGGASTLEQAFDLHVNSYAGIQERKEQMWSRPADGFLSGSIIEVRGEMITLRDFNDETWDITYLDAFIPPAVLLEPGEVIKLIGVQSGKGQFKAEEIRPWGGRMHRGGRKE